MKEYQASRKKLESRRMGFDASTSKLQKLRREDFRVEEELRAAKAKFEESCEDVMRRMQDIKEAEDDSVRDMTSFLDSQIEYHERCTEELRRVRSTWTGADYAVRPLSNRGRSNTAPVLPVLYSDRDRDSRKSSASSIEEETSEHPARILVRGLTKPEFDMSTKPVFSRASTFQGFSPVGEQAEADAKPLANLVALRARAFNNMAQAADENDDTAAKETTTTRRPPPPVPNRATKPPAIPARRIQVGY